MTKNTELSDLNVYYGWSVINRIRKKIAISVIFENENHFGGEERRMNTVNRLQNTCYVRKQTIDEAEDGKHANRVLTEYSLFLHDKQINGNLDLLLKTNYQADINNVPEDILNVIKDTLRLNYIPSYPDNSIRYETENKA
jgi:uncharacterized protein YpuA (DUF1002 family)